MFMKLLILLGAITMFCVFVFRAARGVMGPPDTQTRTGRAPKRAVKAQDLVKCPRCGIFLPKDRTCECTDPA